MLARSLWGMLLLLSCSLLLDFFSFPLNRPLFGTLSAVVAVVTLLAPSAGMVLLLLTTLPTLQVPILLHLPYFSGPEPMLLAFLAAVSVRNVRRPVDLDLPRGAEGLLVLHSGAILASCLLIWLSLWQLPDGWPLLLTADGLSKIFFWRWGNPLNFTRMGLLLLEGIAVFVAARAVYREQAERVVRLFAATLLLLGGLLMAYSTVELLFRGKQITVYPGFGPVFADRNAYAAFWVVVAPIAWVVAVRSRGFIRYLAVAYALSAWLFCLLSLSVSGNAAMLLENLILLIALRPFRRFRLPKRQIRIATGVIVGLAAVVVLAGFAAGRLDRLGLQRRLDSRISFWVPAVMMISERPLLGFGPGEFYRLLPEFRAKAGTLPESFFRQENTHNFYLQLGAETGLLGALSFVGLAFVFVATGFRAVARSRPSSTADEKDSSSLAERAAEHWHAALGGPAMRLGLVISILGILLVCLGQHPLLRFVLSTYFWIAAALIAPSARKTDVASRLRPTVAVALVAAALLLQFSLWAPVDRSRFEYGFHYRESPADDEGVVAQTEGLAFVRKPVDRSETRLLLKNGSETPNQRIRIYRNGTWETRTLSGFEWVPLAVGSSPDGMLEFGVRVPEPTPTPFPDSWGGGIRIRSPADAP